jgi:hypothetical protein
LELDRLKMIHAVVLQALRAGSENSSPVIEHRRLFREANEAWADMECARLELEVHQRGHRPAN